MARLPGLLLAGLLTGLTACAGGGAGAEGGEVASAEAPSRTPPTEPAATDPLAVEPFVERLLARYDRVVNGIIADPAVAADRADPLTEAYIGLFEPGSELAEQALATWAAEAEDGLSVQPFDDGLPALESHLAGDVEAVSDDEVVFPLCIERRMLVYEAGTLRQETPYFAEPGAGTAVRVDGTWRLRRLDVSTGMAGCENRGHVATEAGRTG